MAVACPERPLGSLPEALGAGPKWAMSRSGMRANLKSHLPATQLAGLSHDFQMTIGFEPTEGSTIVPRHDASTHLTQHATASS